MDEKTILSAEQESGSPSRDASSSEGSSPPSARITSRQWLQIVSTFLVLFNTWGLLLTFGAFQTYYKQDLLTDYSSSTLSWVATFCAFALLAMGIVTGPAYDRGFYRQLLISGSLFQVFGLFMLSLSTKYYQVFLSQGVCVGVGAGLTFTPSVAAAAARFPDTATRSKVMGVLACGSSIAGIIYPIIFRALIFKIGFGWTIRVLAFIVLGLYTISWLTLLDPASAQKHTTIRRFFDLSAFTELPFTLLFAGGLASATAYYVPLLYLPLVTQQKVPHVSPNLDFDQLAIVNGASAIGRLLGGAIASKIGPTEITFLSMTSASILLFCWTAVTSVAGVIVWAVFWGMVSGIIVAMPGAFVPSFCPDVSVIGTRTGMYWVACGIGALIGSPIAGAIYDVDTQESWRLAVFSGCVMLAGAAFLVYPVLWLRKESTKNMVA